MYPLSSTSTYPLTFSTCTLPWGQAPSIPLFHISTYCSLSFSIFDHDFHFPFIHPYALSMSIHYPIYIHNSSIYLILTCYPYLAVLYSLSCLFHPFSIHTPICFHPPFICPLSWLFHPIHFISHTSSIPFISLSLFHTLPPISLIHSTFIPMLMIHTRGTLT